MILDDILGETPYLIDKSILSILKAHDASYKDTTFREFRGDF